MRKRRSVLAMLLIVLVSACTSSTVTRDEFSKPDLKQGVLAEPITVKVNGLDSLNFRLKPSSYICNKNDFDIRLEKAAQKLIQKDLLTALPKAVFSDSAQTSGLSMNIEVKDVRADLFCVSAAVKKNPCEATASLRIGLQISRDTKLIFENEELGAGRSRGAESVLCVRHGDAIAKSVNDAFNEALTKAINAVELKN